MSAVPKTADTTVIIEGTSKTIGDDFYHIWQEANDPACGSPHGRACLLPTFGELWSSTRSAGRRGVGEKPSEGFAPTGPANQPTRYAPEYPGIRNTTCYNITEIGFVTRRLPETSESQNGQNRCLCHF